MYLIFEQQKNICFAKVVKSTEHHHHVLIEYPVMLKNKEAKIKLKEAIFSDSKSHSATDFEAAIAGIDIELLWEYAPEEGVELSDLAKEYFSHVGACEIFALLHVLFENPIYFLRKNDVWQKASIEQLNQAKAAVLKRQEQDALKQSYQNQLLAGELPKDFEGLVFELLFQPNKNSIEFKALDAVAKLKNTDIQALFLKLGAIKNARVFHEMKFLQNQFPKGVAHQTPEFGALLAKKLDALPVNNLVQAFSIDDAATTEIDDAFSIQYHPEKEGFFTLGIHIAAPSLGIEIDDHWDRAARERLSTVYAPSQKITMLPDDVISKFTLKEGQLCPALSLYLEIEKKTPINHLDQNQDQNQNAVSSEKSEKSEKLNNTAEQKSNDLTQEYIIHQTTSVAEKIYISHNIRYDLLEDIITPQHLSNQNKAAIDQETRYPHAQEIHDLWYLAQFLFAKRQIARQKFGLRPDQLEKTEYSFVIHGAKDLQNESQDNQSADLNQERVELIKRKRGSPLDLIVAELMILANQTWALFLHEHKLTAIYRTQKTWGGFRTRLQTHKDVHEGLGVEAYIWSTSPLRRYLDLLHQWQILAAIEYGNAAALQSIFNQDNTRVFQILQNFQEVYSAYQEYQQKMEDYWCLRWISQENIKEITGTIGKEGWVRFHDLPLSKKLQQLSEHKGKHVRLNLQGIDELNLSLELQVLEIYEPPMVI
jgi:exoribonuclease II